MIVGLPSGELGDLLGQKYEWSLAAATDLAPLLVSSPGISYPRVIN